MFQFYITFQYEINQDFKINYYLLLEIRTNGGLSHRLTNHFNYRYNPT